MKEVKSTLVQWGTEASHAEAKLTRLLWNVIAYDETDKVMLDEVTHDEAGETMLG